MGGGGVGGVLHDHADVTPFGRPDFVALGRKRILFATMLTSLDTGSGLSYAYLEFMHSVRMNLLQEKQTGRAGSQNIH